MVLTCSGLWLKSKDIRANVSYVNEHLAGTHYTASTASWLIPLATLPLRRSGPPLSRAPDT